MPWQDIHCCINGPAARDVSLNFIQRWNEHRAHLKLRPLPIWPTIHTTKWNFPHGWNKARCQVLRSLSGWSGHSTEEASIYYAMLAAIEHAKHYVCVIPLFSRARDCSSSLLARCRRSWCVSRTSARLRSPLLTPSFFSSPLHRYIESQFFISSPRGTKSVAVNLLAQKLAARLERAFAWEKEYDEPSKFRVAFVLPFHADGMLAESETVTKVRLLCYCFIVLLFYCFIYHFHSSYAPAH